MEAKVVAERAQAVSDVAVAIEQLVATSRVDAGHVTPGPVSLPAAADTAHGAVLLYQPGYVLHQEPVQLAPTLIAAPCRPYIHRPTQSYTFETNFSNIHNSQGRCYTAR